MDKETHNCTYCWGAKDKPVPATHVLKWEGYTYPGRGQNVCHTYLCRTCHDATAFAVELEAESQLISIDSLEDEG